MRYNFLRFPDGKTKALTLSYDDGCRQDLRFSDIVSKYGLKCTFNLTSSEACGNRALSVDEIKTHFLDRGHEIAVHGYFHRAEGQIRPIEGIIDVLDCRRELEAKYDRIVRGMAYPDSGITAWASTTSYDTVKTYLKDLGIVYSRTLGADNDSFALPKDWYAWMPSAHHDNPKLDEYIEKFISRDLNTGYCSSRAPWLFYIWGHSFEFDNKEGGWEHAEDFCKKLSGRPDVWYATNIEIYDYIQAYNSLIFRADNSAVYNPSLMTVWFDIDGTLYSVKSGETLKLNK